MLKKACTVILSLMMFVMLVPKAAFADPVSPMATGTVALIFDVASEQMYYDTDGDGTPEPGSEYPDDGTWSWDGTDTLTLTNFVWQTSADNAQGRAVALYIVGGDLTLDIEGTNTFEVTGTHDGISSAGIVVYYDVDSITITGNGVLNAKGGHVTGLDSVSYGIDAWNDVTIEGGTVNATGGFSEDLRSVGVTATVLSVAGGTLNANSTSSPFCEGVDVEDVQIDGGTLNATGANFTDSQYGYSFGISFWGDFAILDGTVTGIGATSALTGQPTNFSQPYTYWVNTAITPVHNGTTVSAGGTDYAWSDTYKYTRITTLAVYNLTVTAGAGGSVPASASGLYMVDEPVSVTATPDAGNQFLNWTATGVTLGSDTANPASFKMPDVPVTLLANFTIGPAQPVPNIPPTGDSTGVAGLVAALFVSALAAAGIFAWRRKQAK